VEEEDATEAAMTEVGAETVAPTAETRGAMMEDGAAMTAAAEIDRTYSPTDAVAGAMIARSAMDVAVAEMARTHETAARIAMT
jgi:hypothetical protein